MEQRHGSFSDSAGPDSGDFDVHDPLLAVLEYLAGHHQKPFSRAAVLQGLPLTNGLLTLDLFARGAERLGFEAKIVNRRPSEVSGLVCPFVVLLKTGDAAVVLEKHHRSRKVPVIVPGSALRVRRKVGRRIVTILACPANELRSRHA